MPDKQRRRRFLWASTAGAAALALSKNFAPSEARAQSKKESAKSPSRGPAKPPGDFVAQATPSEYFTSRDPGSREMRWGPVKDLGDTIPADRFYIHSRTLPPTVDLQKWRLELTGDAVAKPRSLTFKELLSLPQITLRRTLDCGANCRAFFPPLPRQNSDPKWVPIGFTQWHFGAVGAAEWTGPRLADVLELVGASGGVDAKFTGLDMIDFEGKKVPYEQVISVEKCMASDSILAHRMNGEPLSADHGFPVRVLFSGWGGNSSVKWLSRIEVSRKPLEHGTFQKNQIIAGPSIKMPMTPSVGHIRSALELDENLTISPGDQILRGRAWSGAGAISGVDVSVERLVADGSWQPLWNPAWKPARLLEKPEPMFWTRFELPWPGIAAGRYRIMTRAKDQAGNVQPAPKDVVWNQAGLGYNGHAPLELLVVPPSLTL